jgi:phosphohistidine phosphatase
MSALRLTLLRHAKSSWRFGDLDDHRRPLNRRGLRDALRMPKIVAQRIPRPDLLLASDSSRTVQTAQAIADAYELYDERIILSDEFYLAGHRALLKTLRGVKSSFAHVMLVGHNPGLSELCNYLLAAPIDDLPTFAAAELRPGGASWTQLERGCARLECLLLPREFASAQR